MLSDALQILGATLGQHRETGLTLSTEAVCRLCDLLARAEAEASNMEMRLAVFGPHVPIIDVRASDYAGAAR